VVLGFFFNLESLIYIFLSFFNSNKWFSHISSFLFCVFCHFVVWVRSYVDCCLVRLILRFVAVFIWFILKDQLQSITYLINNLGVDVANPKACVFRWLRIYHMMCCEFICRFTFYTFSNVEYVIVFEVLLIWMNEFILLLWKNIGFFFWGS